MDYIENRGDNKHIASKQKKLDVVFDTLLRSMEDVTNTEDFNFISIDTTKKELECFGLKFRFFLNLRKKENIKFSDVYYKIDFCICKKTEFSEDVKEIVSFTLTPEGVITSLLDHKRPINDRVTIEILMVKLINEFVKTITD